MRTGTRDLHLLSAALGLSALGDWLALVALALHVEANIGSSFALAALFFALWSPSVLLAGPAGLLADRVESRALLIANSVLAAAACVGPAFAHGLIAIVALALVLGCANAVCGAGRVRARPGRRRRGPGGCGERPHGDRALHRL